MFILLSKKILWGKLMKIPLMKSNKKDHVTEAKIMLSIIEYYVDTFNCSS